RLLAADGQPNAALRHYDEVERLLDEELDLKPAPETQALAREIEEASQRAVSNEDKASFPGLPIAPAALPPALSQTPLPTGTVTFLLAEIQRSLVLLDPADE